MSVLDNEKQLVVMDAACHQISLAYQEIMYANSNPQVVQNVIPVPDGDQWVCLLGEDLQVGIAGFGKTPAEAAQAFNNAWHSQKTPNAIFAESKAPDGVDSK